MNATVRRLTPAIVILFGASQRIAANVLTAASVPAPRPVYTRLPLIGYNVQSMRVRK